MLLCIPFSLATLRKIKIKACSFVCTDQLNTILWWSRGLDSGKRRHLDPLFCLRRYRGLTEWSYGHFTRRFPCSLSYPGCRVRGHSAWPGGRVGTASSPGQHLDMMIMRTPPAELPATSGPLRGTGALHWCTSATLPPRSGPQRPAGATTPWTPGGRGSRAKCHAHLRLGSSHRWSR